MMKSIVRLSSLLMAVALLLTGHGLQLALVPVRTQLLEWTSTQVGLLTSVYFLGFISGCFLIPPLVSRIGHIRVFASLSAVTTAVILLLSLTDIFLVWLLLRFLIGGAIVGLYLVIESWLNSQVSNEIRGSILAAYTVIVLSGLALGQLLLNAASPSGNELFILSAILIVLAALPVCLTRSEQPQRIPSARFSPRQLLKTSRVASLGSFISGMVTGAFYGLGPVYGLQRGMELPAVSIMMALGIAGGAFMQLPLGRLSDRMDRRKVILGATICGTAICVLTLHTPPSTLLFLMFGFGASVMPLYALSLAHASDFSDSDDFLQIGTGLLMVNAIGSVIGPLITAALMEGYGPDQFFRTQLAILGGGSVLVAILILLRRRKPDHVTPFALATTAAGQAAIQLDPRSEHEEDAELAIQEEPA